MATKDEDAVTELFVTSTHNPVLFFSTHGKVYRLKVWRLPEGGAAGRGRPMVNLLPLAEGETISTVLPLPEDEAEWGKLHVMFATAKGAVRRNSMDAFANIPTARQVRDALREGWRGSDADRLIGVALLTEEDDVLLATRNGKAIRFAVDRRARVPEPHLDRRARRPADRRRRGHLALDPARLRRRPRSATPISRRALEGKASAKPTAAARARWPSSPRREEFILTVCANGYGKRSSAYEYRRTNRGGQGITNIDNLDRNGPVVASFPAHDGEQLMLVTDQAKLIRMSVGDTRVIGRNSAGVACSTSPRTSMSSPPRGSRRARRRRSSWKAARR